MSGFDLLLTNLMSPIVLAFLLGAGAGFIRSELELPEAVLKLLSIYLLFSIGLTGGRELAKANLADISGLLAVSLLLTVLIPVACFVFLRRFGGFDAANAAAVAAHYGSLSSVTFFAAVAFARAAGTPSEGYITAVVALMEWGVIVALLLARWSMGRQDGNGRLASLMADTLRGRGILLLSGGMLIGALATDGQWNQISPFYESLFRGILMLFLLEMGMTAARQIGGFASVGRFMTGFGILAPVLWGPDRRHAGVDRRAQPRRGFRAGGRGGFRLLHRRAGGLPRRAADGQPRNLPDGVAVDHLPVQPAGRVAALLRLRPLAVRVVAMAGSPSAIKSCGRCPGGRPVDG
jgi:hypothetical protein